jgi:glycosyltransferase involved in cell wall biosynthesis
MRVRLSTSAHKRPSILFVGAMPPPVTGATIACKNLLESRFAEDFHITFINSAFTQELEDIGHFSARKVWRAAKYATRFVLALATKRFEMVVQNHASIGWALFKDSVFALVAARIFRRKVILWLHGNGILDFDRRGWFSRRVVAAGLKSAYRLVVPGERVRSSFVRWVAPENIHPIWHGAGPVIGEACARKSSTKRSVTTVLFFSNLIREKGWLITLEAARQILCFRDDFRFVFCGAWWPSTDEQYACELVRQWGIADRIEFRGRTLGEEKKRAFAESDIFVFPTFFPIETFGIVNLEAMEAGLPIITTARAAIPEIVQDGVNGYIIPEKDSQALAEKILYLADHPEIRHDMGKRNRQEYLEQFTVEKFAERWIEFVNGAIA